MKKTRLFLAASLLTIGAFSTVTMTSCSKDDKICDAGYEGKDCDVEIRAKMIGTYTAADVNIADPSDAPSYVAQISANSAITVVNITNFSGGGSVGGFSNLVTSNIQSTTDGGVSFDIPSQTPDNDGYSVSGNGTFNATSKKITIQYTIKDPLGATNNYTGTWTKN